MNRICLTLPSTGQQICFYIPVLIRKWWDPNPPDPVDRGPSPIPWIQGAEINPEVAQNLQALASIHTLTAALTEVSRALFKTSLRSKSKASSCPEDCRSTWIERTCGVRRCDWGVASKY